VVAYAGAHCGACVSEGTYRDPYKLDCDGMFRLAPLSRRSSKTKRQLTIYSKQTIGDYNYNAVPVYKPDGLGIRDDKTEDPEDKDEWYEIIDDMIDRDMNVLANFIGIKTYRYVFENPI